MTLRESDFHSLKPLSYIGWRFNKQYGTVKRYNERKEYVLTWISEHSSRRFLTDKELQSAFKVLVDLSVCIDCECALSAVARNFRTHSIFIMNKM